MNRARGPILITGACGGLGQAVARQLAQRGETLILTARSEQALRRLVTELPGTHHLIEADLMVATERQALIQALAALPPLQGVIQTAGVQQFHWLSEQSEADINQQIQLNLVVPVLLTRGLMPHLTRQPNTFVMMVGSTFGSLGYPGFTPYCASKFGLRGFTEALARELADQPIRILYTAPRAINTALNDARVHRLHQATNTSKDTPEWVAARLIRALDQSQKRVGMGWPERMFVFLNALFPALIDRVLAAQLPRIKPIAFDSE